jgi:uncharacterized membrane protein
MRKLIYILSPKSIAVILKILIIISLAANIGEFLLVSFSPFASYIFKDTGNEFQSFVFRYFSNHCHQMSERSIFILSQQLPVCNRCVFVMIGNIVVISVLLNRKAFHRFIKNISWIYAIIIPPLVIEAFLKIVFHYPSGFWVRSINGLFQSGLIFSMTFIVLHTLKHINSWRDLFEKFKMRKTIFDFFLQNENK